jgi:hypothetical protein
LRFKLKHLAVFYASIDPDQNKAPLAAFFDPATLSQTAGKTNRTRVYAAHTESVSQD